MEKYDYEQIDKLIQPLIEFMKKEYPHNYEFVISSTSAELRHTSKELMFLSDDLKSMCGLVADSNAVKEKVKQMCEDILGKGKSD